MLDQLGLGVDLTLRDNVSSRVRPIIRELDQLRSQAQQTTSAFNNMNFNSFSRAMGQFTGQFTRYDRLAMYNTALKGTDAILRNVTKRFVDATVSANNFAKATNRLTGMTNFSRMYSQIMRAQMMLGNMGFGASGMQKHSAELQAFNMLNYQMKDLQDRIALTKKGIQQMMASPDASKFVREIGLAKQALKAYEQEMSQVNAKQKMAGLSGYTLHNLGGKDTYVHGAHSVFQNIGNRLYGASMLDVAGLSNLAYKSLDKTGKAMVGLGYTTMETRMKLAGLTMQMQMTGMALSQYLTAPLALATAGFGALMSKVEDSMQVFGAQTLMGGKGMQNWSQSMLETYAQTGASMPEIANVMANLKNNSPKMSQSQAQWLTQAGIQFQQVWGATQGVSNNKMTVSAVQATSDLQKLMSTYKVSGTQALNIYTLALKKANGSEKDAMTYIGGHIKALEGLTSAGHKGANAYQKLNDAMNWGGMQTVLQGMREIVKLMGTIWFNGGLSQAFTKLGNGIYNFANSLNTLLQTTPKLAKFVAITGVLSVGLLASIGPVGLLTSALVNYRNVFQGISAGIFGFAKTGGFSVLAPQAVMAREQTRAFTVALARLPQTLGAVGVGIFTLLRMLPQFAFNILKLNPAIGLIGLGVLAFMKNWGGFRDDVKKGIADIKVGWHDLENMYKSSPIPKIFVTLKQDWNSFVKGFSEGISTALKMGNQLYKNMLLPIINALKPALPLFKQVGDSISKMFGMGGNNSSSWENIGKWVGILTVGLAVFKGLKSIAPVLASPFNAMASAISNADSKTKGLISTIGALVRETGSKIGGTVSGIVSPIIGSARQVVSPVINGARASRNSALNGLAMMGLTSTMNARRMRAGYIRDNLNVRNSGYDLSNVGVNNGIYRTGTGRNRISRSVFVSRQGALSRALFGQRFYTFQEQRDAQGHLTGMQRNLLLTRGGLFRRRSGDNSIVDRNLPRAYYDATIGRGLGAVRGGLGRVGGAILSPFRGAYDRALGGIAGSRVGRAFGRVTGYMGERLSSAGVRNPFGGITGTAGMSRRSRAMHFLGTGARGIGTLGRGAMRMGMAPVRMAGRMGMGAMRGVGGAMRGLGGLMFNPWVMMGTMAGSALYHSLGKGKDGKVSANNIAGNIDKITAGFTGKQGTKKISAFWKSFKKIGGDIFKSTGKLLLTTFKALSPLLPKIMKQAWDGIKAGAKIAWAWMKTSGVKYLGEFWHWLTGTAFPAMVRTGKSLLGKLWKWIQTDGAKDFGALVKWIIGTAIPKVVSTGMSLLGKLLHWVFTQGVKDLGSLLKWVITSFVPAVAKAIGNGIVAGVKGIGSGISGFLSGLIHGGGGHSTKKHAFGGIYNNPHIGLVAEAGPEAIIPMSSSKRGIGEHLLNKTASQMGYTVSKGAPVRSNQGTGGNVDNSVTIQKMELHLPESMAGVGQQQVKQQAIYMMKELQKLMKVEKTRSGKNVTLEDMILNY